MLVCICPIQIVVVERVLVWGGASIERLTADPKEHLLFCLAEGM
ncbi:MAG: hypothetical protein V8R91_21645 [Butyricimonas faecihominis]